MAELTPGQKAAAEKRARRAEATAQGKSGQDLETSVPPASLKLMLGLGEKVTIDGRSYEIARLYLKDREQFHELIAPYEMAQLVALANAYDEETDEYDMEQMATFLNNMIWVAAAKNPELAQKIQTGEMPSATAQSCAYEVTQLTINGPDDETRNLMNELVALALSRRHPEIKAEDVSQFLDLTDFLAVVRVIFRLNRPLRERF